jgi:hypothetical protein
MGATQVTALGDLEQCLATARNSAGAEVAGVCNLGSGHSPSDAEGHRRRSADLRDWLVELGHHTPPAGMLAYLLIFMTRAFRYRNFDVYVLCERGQPHHHAHAHIELRGTRVASVFLETLEIFDMYEQIPKELVEVIHEKQEELIDLWSELNEDE